MSKEQRKGGRPYLGDKGRVHRVNLRLTADEMAILDEATEQGDAKDRATLVRDLALDALKAQGYGAKKVLDRPHDSGVNTSKVRQVVHSRDPAF